MPQVHPTSVKFLRSLCILLPMFFFKMAYIGRRQLLFKLRLLQTVGPRRPSSARASNLEPISAPTTFAAVDRADELPDHKPCCVEGTCRVHRPWSEPCAHGAGGLERMGAAQKVGEVQASG